MEFSGAAAGMRFQIQSGIGGVREVAIEAQAVARESCGAVVFMHCTHEGGFHGVEEVHVLLLCPERRRFGRRHVRGGVHCGGGGGLFGDSEEEGLGFIETACEEVGWVG